MKTHGNHVSPLKIQEKQTSATWGQVLTHHISEIINKWIQQWFDETLIPCLTWLNQVWASDAEQIPWTSYTSLITALSAKQGVPKGAIQVLTKHTKNKMHPWSLHTIVHISLTCSVAFTHAQLHAWIVILMRQSTKPWQIMVASILIMGET